MEHCGFQSCRHCGEESHIPLRCDEVEKKKDTDGRTRVEEAAAAAMIRRCPKCNQAVMKSDGCNKMTCSCGVKFCYLCQKQVKDYSHFCQIPHCTHKDKKKCKNKCPLWTGGTSADDEKASREAALAEATKLALKPAEGVQIDVDSILRAPPKIA